MASDQGEKIHAPTQRRLEEALRRGQIPISAEVQTAIVLVSILLAFTFAGRDCWKAILIAFTGVLGHLHQFVVSTENLQRDAVSLSVYYLRTVGSLVLAVMVGGLLAGGLQSRFQTFSEILKMDWMRVNPVEGLGRIFSTRAAVPTAVALAKFTVIALLTYGQVMKILQDPIFASAVTPARIADFLYQTAFSIIVRITVALCVIASMDYGYQFWKNRRDLMMTREELQDEQKSSEGNPEMKAAVKKRRQRVSHRKMLADVPTADVVVTNPTHLAVALRYDRKTMKAPTVVAKGSRLNALKIREIAKQHQIPIVENKPLARMLFKYSKVGGEIPAQFYAAVAELLAYVYRVNRYRYYTEQNRPRE